MGVRTANGTFEVVNDQLMQGTMNYLNNIDYKLVQGNVNKTLVVEYRMWSHGQNKKMWKSIVLFLLFIDISLNALQCFSKLRFCIYAGQVDIISNKLSDLKVDIPDCFAWTPWPLTDMDYWKATEFRLFLLYTDRIVLKDGLPEDMYYSVVNKGQIYINIGTSGSKHESLSIGGFQHAESISKWKHHFRETFLLVNWRWK